MNQSGRGVSRPIQRKTFTEAVYLMRFM